MMLNKPMASSLMSLRVSINFLITVVICLWVCYTVNTFAKPDGEMTSVSFNVHWIMLLTLPGKFYQAH
jgi:hypothetical protein